MIYEWLAMNNVRLERPGTKDWSKLSCFVRHNWRDDNLQFRQLRLLLHMPRLK